MFKIMQNMNLVSKFYLIILIFFIFYIFNAFENTYIILKNNYENRVLKYSGYCEKQGYGFIKKISFTFPDINLNLQVYNNSDFPSAIGYFYDFRKNYNDNFLILLNFEEKNLIKFSKKNFRKIYQEDKCYLLKKND
jgi:hypothetical protein